MNSLLMLQGSDRAIEINQVAKISFGAAALVTLASEFKAAAASLS